ncbi:hypothetical protein BDP27DRAFT_1412391 [Rhodocollybia butyracea]|uniref:Uncharacterized protein n=1 Tax=Rhodocollybia butyracea TaxID=206335 RepID=A0A9P5QAS6_9AGAR|nr:hypothetical protein BDP27DRAFT_1412391 [Rhodocollybia butyracea]
MDNSKGRGSTMIYSNNMTLGLAIGSKSTRKNESTSPRLLRKPQSTAKILEKVLPTIPPWVLVDAIGINRSPPSPLSPSQSVPTLPSSPLNSPILYTPPTANSLTQVPASPTLSPSESESRSVQEAFRSLGRKSSRSEEPYFDIVIPSSNWNSADKSSAVLPSLPSAQKDEVDVQESEEEDRYEEESASSLSGSENTVESDSEKSVLSLSGSEDTADSNSESDLDPPWHYYNTPEIHEEPQETLRPHSLPSIRESSEDLEKPITVVRSRPLPTPPTTRKPRPPTLVLVSPPIRSSSLSPMHTGKIFSSRDRDLPSLPPSSPFPSKV